MNKKENFYLLECERGAYATWQMAANTNAMWYMVSDICEMLQRTNTMVDYAIDV